MSDHKTSNTEALREYFSDRLSTMLAEAGRCGVTDTSAIKHKSAMALDWALANRLTVTQVKFSELQSWVQAEELETTADQEVLTFAVEFLETEPHQQAIAKNPNASERVLAQVIKQATVRTMTVVASNPNVTDAMLEGLLDTAHRIDGSVGSRPRNMWPEKTGADHRADEAEQLRNAVLRAQESRKANPAAE